MLRAICVAAITGSTISAAISRIPTIRIETATVSRGEHRERRRSGTRTGTPGDASALLVECDARPARGTGGRSSRARRSRARPRARGRCG